MRIEDKKRLYADLARISDQMGILRRERPKLVTNRKERKCKT